VRGWPMSYCRWSSDDYQCDIYAYEAETGFVVHVASSRRRFAEPLPEPVSPSEDFDGWWKRLKTVSSMLDQATSHPIGLQNDGESFSFDTPGECADKLVHLRELGYNVPEYAIDSLREEQASR